MNSPRIPCGNDDVPLSVVALLMYDVRAIGNWFLDRADADDKPLTAMKLQKLAYVAHGWFLAYTDNPLVHDAVEAWKWGPVFRSLYREFRDFGSDSIATRAIAFDGGSLCEKQISLEDYGDAKETSDFLEGIWQGYGGYSAGQLSNITHREGTPWHQMYERMGNNIEPFTVIPNEMIKEHYKNLALTAWRHLGEF